MTATGYAVDQAVAAALSAVLASAFALQILVGWASASAQQAQQPCKLPQLAFLWCLVVVILISLRPV